MSLKVGSGAKAQIQICFICTIRPILFIGWFNTFSATFFCTHSAQSAHPHCQRSTPLSLFSYGTAIFLLISAGATTTKLAQMKLSELLLSVMMVQSSLITMVVTISLQKYTTKQIDHLHGLVYIVENRRNYDIPHFFDGQFRRDVHAMLYKFFGPYLLLTVIIISASLYNYQNLTGELVFKLVTLLINIFSNLSNSQMTILFIHIYTILLRRCHEQIENTLTLHFDKNTSSFTWTKVSLRRKLQSLQKLHLSILANFQLVRSVFSANLLFFWIGFCEILIANFFLVILSIRQQRACTDEEILSFVLYVAAFLGSNVFFNKAQDLRDESRETLSFLYRCRLSKLSPMESAQVEMLIATLEIQKPELKASDIFTIGTGLLASVSGTVLTYVLVALQFHALWSRK